MNQLAIAKNKFTAEDLLKENLAAVFAILKKPDLDQEAKKNKIIEIINSIFDLSLTAKLTLGRKNWSGLTLQQKERFTQLFAKYLGVFYLDYLMLYTDEKVFYEVPVEVRKKVYIPTVLVSKEKKISILYKLYKSGSHWKIYDLEIQGVSTIRSYRSQFRDLLKSGTFDDLLAKLEQLVND